MTKFEKELNIILNCNSMENTSNTPDYILASYMAHCLAAFNEAVRQRETWHGRDARPGVAIAGNPEVVAQDPDFDEVVKEQE
jgi:hypothetical protein